MPGEGRIDERVVRVEQFVDGTIVLDEVDEETDRLFEHRSPQLVIECREPRAIDAVVLLEAAEVEPVAAELGRQAPDAIIVQQPPRLGHQHPGSAQVTGGGTRQQRRVGHARPEEIAQAAGERVIRQWPDGGARPRQVDAVAEVRRHEHADDRVAHGVFVIEPVALA